MTLKSINPYTNKLIAEFEEFSVEQIEKILSNSAEAFETWRRTEINHRKELIGKAANMLRSNISEYAGAITAEMGKPIKESKAEVEKCAWVCEYYAMNTEKFLKDESLESDADISYVSYEPLGTILGIMPWNYPFWQVFRFAVPTIMAGNTVLLKHASNVQISARHIENIFSGAGFPQHVFRNLVVGAGGVEKIIRHDTIKAISLTGSEPAGQKVASVAGDTLKKCVLELGGSNAFIVLEDADIGKAVETAIKARFQNGGQSCIAGKRFIIEKNISDSFIRLFAESIRKLKTGDPSDEETDIGPLCSKRQAESIDDQVKRSVAMGARIIEGGSLKEAFYNPTLAVDVRPGMPLFDEEVFGPVAPVIIADNACEAITLANKTNFGLGVTLFTTDIKKAVELVSEFHDGAVFINGQVKSDPRLPFGGTKRSGYGRELAQQGMREFVNVKTVWIRK